MNDAYKRQVRLLLNVLPEIAKEDCFAMHGGTAINLFLQDMPRLSVDIDLTYVEIAERAETLDAINAALLRTKERIEKLSASIRIQHKPNVCKLQISQHGVQIKVEVNMVGRGLLGPATKTALCSSAQEQYDVFCAMPVVPLGQLYGGKLCAALDRQHPRDLFDTKLLLEGIGFTDEIKRGFIFSLISSNRPTHEMLEPNLLDQLAEWHGYPEKIRVDNGSEFTSEVFVNWAKAHDIMIDYIKPGCPYQNAYIERFNRTYRDDVLDCYIFNNLNDVKQITEDWIELYNNERPHDSLNDMTPFEYRNAA